jgi:hypothetical protein
MRRLAGHNMLDPACAATVRHIAIHAEVHDKGTVD